MPLIDTNAECVYKKERNMESNDRGEKREDRRVRRTKRLLTQALTQLMQKKQVKEITVRELTELADVNRGTFYLYYRDIFDMLEQIENEMFGAFDRLVALADDGDIARSIRPVLLDVFSFIGENRELCRVLLSPNGDMNFLHRLNEVLREKCLRLWDRSGLDESGADFEYYYSFMIFGCAGLIHAWVNRGCPEPAEQMAEMADGMLRRGSLIKRGE